MTEEQNLKGTVFMYPDTRDVYYHPKTDKELQDIYQRMIDAKKNEDTNGIFTCAMQLIPKVAMEKKDLIKEGIEEFIAFHTKEDMLLDERQELEEGLKKFMAKYHE
jgi:hypothetical protein